MGNRDHRSPPFLFPQGAFRPPLIAVGYETAFNAFPLGRHRLLSWDDLGETVLGYPSFRTLFSGGRMFRTVRLSPLSCTLLRIFSTVGALQTACISPGETFFTLPFTVGQLRRPPPLRRLGLSHIFSDVYGEGGCSPPTISGGGFWLLEEACCYLEGYVLYGPVLHNTGVEAPFWWG